MTSVLSVFVQVSLLSIWAAVVHLVVARRTSAAARHLLLTGVVAGLLFLPVVALVFPRWTIVEVRSEPQAFTSSLSLGVPPVGDRLTATALPFLAGRPAAEARVVSRFDLSWNELVVLLYAAGVLLLSGRLLLQRWSVRRFLRRAVRLEEPQWTALLDECASALGLRRRVRLLRSFDETMPMTCGTLWPAIVLPAAADDWPADRRRAVLLHELAHVARFDCLTQSLAVAARTIYWGHPGVWWVARRLRAERELASDDRVLSAGADAHEYAGHLLEIAHAMRPAPVPALAVTMAAAGQLESRLRALIDPCRRRGVPRLRVRLAAFAGMTFLLAAVAGVRLTSAHAFAAPAGAAAPLLAIQGQPADAFEVASVRPNTSAETGGFIQRRPGGSFAVGNQTLRTLIGFAYQLQQFQLVDAPPWINTERFDIVAKAGRELPTVPFGAVSPEAMMLRTLLADRFKLVVHRETRPMPIYELVVARGDGQLGPRLRRPSSDFCDQRRKASEKSVLPPALPTDPMCGISGTSSELMAGSFPLSEFVRFLAGAARRPVVDRTGLTGGWDFDLKWSPPDAANPDPDRPSLFTALQEQLGLRLDATTGPVEVLVVDRVERPTPD